MLGVVLSDITDWLTQNMRTGQPRPLWQKGWQEKEIFQWGRQNSSCTLMTTSKSNDNGHLVDSAMNTCANRCSSMPLPLARANMTVPFIRARGNHHQNETWGQNLPQWSSFAPTWEDIQDLYRDVYQLWRLPGRGQCEEATKEHLCQDILDSLKETSSSSGHLHSQRGNEDRCWPTSLGLIIIQSSLWLTAAPMRSSPL